MQLTSPRPQVGSRLRHHAIATAGGGGDQGGGRGDAGAKTVGGAAHRVGAASSSVSSCDGLHSSDARKGCCTQGQPRSANRTRTIARGQRRTQQQRRAMLEGVQNALDDCIVAVHELLKATDLLSIGATLAVEAERSMRLLNMNHGRFDCVCFAYARRVACTSKVGARHFRPWFEGLEKFEPIDLLVRIISDGVPVLVSGYGYVIAALLYGNNSLPRRYPGELMQKTVDAVLTERAFVFPHAEAESIPGLRVSPFTVAVSPNFFSKFGCMPIFVRRRFG